MTKQTIMMCAPDFFGVDYVINPWMEGQHGKTDAKLAMRQWLDLKALIEIDTPTALIAPQPGVPDIVFTANAGFVIGNKVVVSRFRSKERQPEEPFFRAWFKDYGFEIADWPQDVSFEGAGDALLDRAQDLIWCAYGFRSDTTTAKMIERIYSRRTIALKLTDPRFYHIDTCLCPLEGGYLMYFPTAFDTAGQTAIEAAVPTDKRIIVGEQDALSFACNAVNLGKRVIMNGATQNLQDALHRAGFTPVITPLSEFMKAGGAAKCLTLKLYEA